MRFSRVVLKLSGECLAGERGGLDEDALRRQAHEIAQAHARGVELAVVPGGGNILRGHASGLPRTTADLMGMFSTLINALALAEHLRDAGVPAFVRSAFAVKGVPAFDAGEAKELMGRHHVGVFAAGTGNPFFTTDTAAALRALEVGAQALLKGTKVEGVYSADPKKDPSARRYLRISYDEVLRARLGFMDQTAIALCREHGLPVLVFNQTVPNALCRALEDEGVGTLVGFVESLLCEPKE